jgi:adenine-specific DNA-methyltransferase
MIYIDPPYNTGKDFVYKDNFTQDKAEYDEESGNVDDEGGRLVSNPDSNGRYHSDWLSMMYPRLKLARNLLKDDGVIFISIDDNEAHNLRKIGDEIFGESSFLANFVWKKKGTTSNVKGVEVSSQTDSTLCYKKQQVNSINQRVVSKDTRSHSYSDEEGAYRLVIIEKKDSGSYSRETMKFAILGHTPRKGKRWQIGEKTAKELEKKNRFIYDGEKIKLKIYSFEEEDTYSAQPNLLDSHGTTDTAAKLVNNELFGISELFDNPKPLELVQHLINIGTHKADIILDFFSGSATTAHAVMQLNFEDGGDRKFIMLQIPEITDKKSEAYKADYANIAEIGKERIRRAGEKIKEDNADKEGISDLDIGFRVLKVDSSNMKDVYFSPDNTSQDDMFDLASNIKDDRTDEDLLFMVLLDWGIDLSVKIECREVAGKTVYFADDNFLAACFEENLDENFVKALVVQQPLKVVLRDSGFASSSVKINVEQIFKQADIEVKVI